MTDGAYVHVTINLLLILSILLQSVPVKLRFCLHLIISNRFWEKEKSMAYVMTDFDSVDIDGALDYELAKICMNRLLSGDAVQE